MGACSKKKQQPVLPRHGGSSPPEGPGDVCVGVTCLILIGIPIYAIVWFVVQISTEPEYSVAITAVSGLSPATDLQPGRGVLSPVFNLTVGIASHSALYGACINPGTSISVSYSRLRLPLAGGRAPDMCVRRRQSAELRAVVARGYDVALPGFLVDTLAEEMRRGEAMFEVTLTGLEDGRWKVVTCWATAGASACP
ncbi:hypothetical protein ACP70R_026640 [Stipagrostis hirtigluma subsp. patula]